MEWGEPRDFFDAAGNYGSLLTKKRDNNRGRRLFDDANRKVYRHAGRRCPREMA